MRTEVAWGEWEGISGVLIMVRVMVRVRVIRVRVRVMVMVMVMETAYWIERGVGYGVQTIIR